MNQKRIVFNLYLIVFTIIVGFTFTGTGWAKGKISKPGFYKGYSVAKYDCCDRKSIYVTMPTDGTRIALDIYRPLIKGTQKVANKPFPVTLSTSRYHRNLEIGGHPLPLDKNHLLPYSATFVKHGYVVAIADVRGAGASFGVDYGPLSPTETDDSFYIIQWLAHQSWSTGKIGMFGLSYLGMTQFMAASKKPPALKAIFPQVAFVDMYSFGYNNGIWIDKFLDAWGNANVLLDANITIKEANIFPATRVDEDKDGSMRAAASFKHGANFMVYEEFNHLPYRNSLDRHGTKLHMQNSPYTYFEEIQDSRVAIYALGGWFDGFTRDIFIPFNTLGNPQKVVVGPWEHVNRKGFDMISEHLRWFDYHLKGIQNGIMDEAPITYYTMNAKPGREWKTAREWPLAKQKATKYYFRSGKSGTVNSVNDGVLSLKKPKKIKASDQYRVDYLTTTGKSNRWYATAGMPFKMSDRKLQDEKGLTYTSSSLASDLEVTGHPVMHLWISSRVSDNDFFAYLEDVDKNGVSHYISEGRIRVSHRAVSYPPYAFAGLPFHRGNAEDVKPLNPGEQAELVFDILATSYVFRAGHRIRVTVTGADSDNFYTPKRVIPPSVTVYRNKTRASHIVLPVIP